MGVFTPRTNSDAGLIDPASGALGPRLGFLGAYEASHETQTRAWGAYSLEHYWMELEQDQLRRIREAGGEPHDTLSGIDYNWAARNLPGPSQGSGTYLDTARFFVDGGTPEQAERVRRYDERVNALREQFPDLELLTSAEMFEHLQSEAQAVEAFDENLRTGFFGGIGYFVGEMLGSMSPNTDPLNFTTAPLAPGRTAVQRIGAQFGLQGVVETINQLSGAQENRRLLGLDYGLDQALTQIGMTAIAGGVFQGVGEGFAALGRRWFRHTPTDPAPAPESLLAADPGPSVAARAEPPRPAAPERPTGAAAPTVQQLLLAPRTYVDIIRELTPLNRTAIGARRAEEDLIHVDRQLSRWDGQRPWELTPNTDTAIGTSIGARTAAEVRFTNTRTVDEIARQVDPRTFQIYDKLAERQATYRRWLDEMAAPQREEVSAQVRDLRTQVADLEVRKLTSNARTAKKYQERINGMLRQIDEVQAGARTADTPDMTRIRTELRQTDEKMRDLAPVVTRAYAKAQNKWQLDRSQRKAVEEMIQNGLRGTSLIPRDPEAAVVGRPLVPEGPPATPRPIEADVPILNTRPDVVAARRADEDAADIVNKIQSADREAGDDAALAWASAIPRLVKDAETAGGTIGIDGYNHRFALDDKVVVPNEADDGFHEVSVRSLLDDANKAVQVAESVKSCPLPAAS